MNNIRIAVIFERFGPYHVARLNECGNHFESIGIELLSKDNIYLWDTVLDNKGFKRITLFENEISNNHQLVEKISRLLSSIAPDAVAIPGWALKGCVAAIEWCCKNNVPIVLMSDSQSIDKARSSLKEYVKKQIVGLAGAGFVAGSRHVDYFSELGMPVDRIFQGYDVVDNAHFSFPAKSSGLSQSAQVTRPYFLSVCRFVSEKNLFFLMDAYAEYLRDTPAKSHDLILAGDGPLKDSLKKHVIDLEIGHRVHFPGFYQYDQLPALYWGAAAFILPSVVEPWGLVVNEAMASGLPVLVSNRCGCVPELVREGVNGFSFDPTDRAGLKRMLMAISDGSVDTAAMGQSSRRIIADWSPDTFARNLLAAAEVAMRNKRTCSFFDRLILKGLIYR